MQVVVDTEDVYGEKYQYDCGDFKLESQGQDCVPGVNCSQTKVQEGQYCIPMVNSSQT
jgi:hypothetical protein